MKLPRRRFLQLAAVAAGFLRVAYSFFAGVLVYRLWRDRHPKLMVPPLIIALVLGLSLVLHPPETLNTAYDLTAVLLVFPVLVYLGANSAASGFMTSVFSWMGSASYAAYVLQAPIYGFLIYGSYKAGINVDQSPWTFGLFFIALVIVSAGIADKYFDRPVRQLMSQLRFRHRRSPVK
jgi:peptidoglycan/LPS O-acetylase OafA/YrhL